MSMWYCDVRTFRIVLRDRGEALIPIRHAVNNPVRFRRGRHMPLRARHRELEGIPQDTVAAATREHGHLNGGLRGCATVEATADFRVLAFVVLAHDHHVDVGGPAVRERRSDTFQQANRSEVDVLAEAAPNGNQQSPQGHVIGHTGEANRAEIDGFESAKLLKAVLRHHAAGPRVHFAAPIEGLPLKLEAEPAAGGLEHAHTLRNDLFADPVAGNYRNPMSHYLQGVRGTGGSAFWFCAIAGTGLICLRTRCRRLFGNGPCGL